MQTNRELTLKEGESLLSDHRSPDLGDNRSGREMDDSVVGVFEDRWVRALDCESARYRGRGLDGSASSFSRILAFGAAGFHYPVERTTTIIGGPPVAARRRVEPLLKGLNASPDGIASLWWWNLGMRTS